MQLSNIKCVQRVQISNMTINLTITPYEYALACLGAAALGKTLDAAIVQAQVSVTVQAPGKEGC